MLKFLVKSTIHFLIVIMLVVGALPLEKSLAAANTTVVEKMKKDQKSFGAKAVTLPSKKIKQNRDLEASFPAPTASKEDICDYLDGLVVVEYEFPEPEELDIDENQAALLSPYFGHLLQSEKGQFFLRMYINKKGKNLLHLTRDLGTTLSDLQSLFNKDGVTQSLDYALRIQDSEDKTPLEDMYVSPKEMTLLKEIHPDLLHMPTGPANITPLMGLALTFGGDEGKYAPYKEELQKDEVHDIYGNTAWNLATQNCLGINSIIANKIEFNDNPWQEIAGHPYMKLRMQNRYDSFSRWALDVFKKVNSTHVLQGTAIRNCFFQLDHFEKKKEAIELWQNYFDELDTLRKEKSHQPLRLRVMDTVIQTEFADKETSLAQIVSTGGMFGFKDRKATSIETEIMEKAIKTYVDITWQKNQNYLELKYFLGDLFREYKGPTIPKAKVDSHQLTCVIIASNYYLTQYAKKKEAEAIQSIEEDTDLKSKAGTLGLTLDTRRRLNAVSQLIKENLQDT